MKKAPIIAIAFALIVVCVAGFMVWKINDDKVKKEMAILADISSIQEQVNTLYQDEQKKNLADPIDKDMIQRVHNLFAAYDNKELSPEASALLAKASSDISDVDKMYALKQSIDNLFDENGAIVESPDIESSKSQLEALKSDKPAFVADLTIKINEAASQFKQISAATKKVDSLFTSSEKTAVKKSIKQTEINEAKASVKKIKQHKAKTDLLSYVQVADVYLDAKIKAEAKAKAEAEAKERATAQKNSSSKKSNDTLDLKGWVPYSTGDAATLLKYLASGDVVEYNGQYWASPELVNMMANEEVVYIQDIAND
ncbi:toxin Cry1Ac domain D-VI-related protein [Paenibacillus sp. TH7-28]